MTKRVKLKVEVVDRGQVLSEHQGIATSDLEAGMISGSLAGLSEADLIVVKEADGERFSVLNCRVSFDEVIKRIRG